MEMICADFLAGAHLDNDNPEIPLNSISRYYRFLPSAQRKAFLAESSGRPHEDASSQRTGFVVQEVVLDRVAALT